MTNLRKSLLDKVCQLINPPMDPTLGGLIHLTRTLTPQGNHYIASYKNYYQPLPVGYQIDAHTEVIGHCTDNQSVSWELEKLAIAELNQIGRYNIFNSRFDSNVKMFIDYGLAYVFSVYCEPTRKYFIEPVINLINRLYRMFVSCRITCIRDDLAKYSSSAFKVRVYGYHRLCDINNKLHQVYDSLGLSTMSMSESAQRLYNPQVYRRLYELGYMHRFNIPLV